ncbi:hypothetical protein AN958_12775 [Leucoagaricus sp. SymC.cos]|nr:hypothetical protein AN958_12775 [Leucoagaricus sp. SymC.cos]
MPRIRVRASSEDLKLVYLPLCAMTSASRGTRHWVDSQSDHRIDLNMANRPSMTMNGPFIILYFSPLSLSSHKGPLQLLPPLCHLVTNGNLTHPYKRGLKDSIRYIPPVILHACHLSNDLPVIYITLHSQNLHIYVELLQPSGRARFKPSPSAYAFYEKFSGNPILCILFAILTVIVYVIPFYIHDKTSYRATKDLREGVDYSKGLPVDSTITPRGFQRSGPGVVAEAPKKWNFFLNLFFVVWDFIADTVARVTGCASPVTPLVTPIAPEKKDDRETSEVSVGNNVHRGKKISNKANFSTYSPSGKLQGVDQ